jgi:hypothetical protein
MKTYEFLQESPPEEDIKQRTIVAKEESYTKDAEGGFVVSETVEEKFTMAQLEVGLADIDRQISSLEEQRIVKEEEIATIKLALGME